MKEQWARLQGVHRPFEPIRCFTEPPPRREASDTEWMEWMGASRRRVTSLLNVLGDDQGKKVIAKVCRLALYGFQEEEHTTPWDPPEEFDLELLRTYSENIHGHAWQGIHDQVPMGEGETAVHNQFGWTMSSQRTYET